MSNGPKRSRGFAFTINNPSEEDLLQLERLRKDAAYLIVGRETAETGTSHLQCYCYFKHARPLKKIAEIIRRAHIESAKGSPQQNRTYCSKAGDFSEYGDCPVGAVGKFTKFEERAERNKTLLSKSLNDLVNDGDLSLMQVPLVAKARMILSQQGDALQTESTRGVWIYGPPGVGKTHHAHSWYPDLYVKAQNKWWDGYTGQEAVLLDDLDTPHLGHLLKIWSDKWPCSGEIKGGTVHLRHKIFIVTSNYLPDDLWKDDSQLCEAIQRRFELKHFLTKQF